jgi:hypothetical protein
LTPESKIRERFYRISDLNPGFPTHNFGSLVTIVLDNKYVNSLLGQIFSVPVKKSVFPIRILKFLSLPDPDLLVRGMDPDRTPDPTPNPAPGPSIIEQK